MSITQHSRKSDLRAVELSQDKSRESEPRLSKDLSITVLKSPQTTVGTEGSILSTQESKKVVPLGIAIGGIDGGHPKTNSTMFEMGQYKAALRVKNGVRQLKFGAVKNNRSAGVRRPWRGRGHKAIGGKPPITFSRRENVSFLQADKINRQIAKPLKEGYPPVWVTQPINI